MNRQNRKNFDLKKASVSDLRTAYLNEKTWLDGTVLKAVVALLLASGPFLLGRLISHFDEAQTEGLIEIMWWVNGIAAFTVATGLVMFGTKALGHFKRMQCIRDELQSRGYWPIQ